MADQGPFVPPSGAVPPGAWNAPAAVPAPAASPLPPPIGPPRVPPPPRRRRWLIPVIAGGGALLLGLGALGVWGAVQLGQTLRQLPVSAPPPAVPAPPLAGDPGEPVAEVPLECDGCFTFYDATTLHLTLPAYQRIGLDSTDGDAVSTDALTEHDMLATQWSDGGGEPAECAFAFPQAPIGDPAGELDAASADDRVHYPPWHWDADGIHWLAEGIRLFDDSDAASAHLESLAAGVAACDAYALPQTGWAVTVVPAAALDLPPSVAGYGWVESGGYNRYYAVDLQRGNLVLRITLTANGTGPSEAAFRDFVEAYAVELAELVPTG